MGCEEAMPIPFQAPRSRTMSISIALPISIRINPAQSSSTGTAGIWAMGVREKKYAPLPRRSGSWMSTHCESRPSVVHEDHRANVHSRRDPVIEDLMQNGDVPKAVMFDLDGTLIDSVPTYFRIAEAMLREVGLPPAPRDAVVAVIKEGLSGFHRLIPGHMSDRKEELINACMRAGREISSRLYTTDTVRLIPGATSLFSRLTEAGIRIGIVTSSHTAFVERKLSPLKEAGIDGMIHAVVALEDTMQQKPSPEPIMACLKRLQVSGNRSVYVGDADVDIMAGRGAGTRTIGVLTGVDDYETLARHLPDLIVDGIEDLVRLF